MHRWFAYVEREFERFIGKDPFDDIVAMLVDGVPLSFSRFGDGEFSAIFGVEGANCDGHPYYPDLGARLREIVAGDPGYMVGLQPLAVAIHGARHIYEVAGEREWVLADALHLASVEGRLGRFFEALAEREVIVVGAPYLAEFAMRRGWRHCTVPEHKCWMSYSEVREELRGAISSSGDVVLFCASMMSNVLIDDLHRLAPGNTYIDAGSVLDPYAGVITRAYHAELPSDAARQPSPGAGPPPAARAPGA